jgi:hypothetical protein
VLLGDLYYPGRGPRRIGFRHIPLTKATPTYIHSNLNFAGTDQDGGAGIALWSDETGDSDGGQLQLIAYGQGTGAFANSLRFSTSGGERMCIDSRGRVGIGTGTPYHTLEVRGDMNVGTAHHPGGIIFYDEIDGSAWRLQVTAGKLELARIEPAGKSESPTR